MIAIIDYGLGNVRAIANVYKQLLMPAAIVSAPDGLREADRLILPGVGSFDKAIELLEMSGMRDTLDELVLKRQVPVLGICVGMQVLARSSEEGILPGLGWLDAEVKRFNFSSSDHQMPIPHMGWNNIRPMRRDPLMEQLDEGARFYFLHSYYMRCDSAENALAVTEYGSEFTCAVNHLNVYGVQFHPEKSHGFGIQLLSNFGKL